MTAAELLRAAREAGEGFQGPVNEFVDEFRRASEEARQEMIVAPLPLSRRADSRRKSAPLPVTRRPGDRNPPKVPPYGVETGRRAVRAAAARRSSRVTNARRSAPSERAEATRIASSARSGGGLGPAAVSRTAMSTARSATARPRSRTRSVRPALTCNVD